MNKLIQLTFLFIFGVFLISFASAEHPLPTDLVTDDIGLLEGMGNWANNVTFGAFWFLLLAGFCFVLFMATVKYGTDRAFGYAGVTALLGSISLLIIGWIHWTYASMLIVAGALGIVFMIKNK